MRLSLGAALYEFGHLSVPAVRPQPFNNGQPIARTARGSFRAPWYDPGAHAFRSAQRDYWTGQQTELGDAWTLRKGAKVARCVLMSH